MRIILVRHAETVRNRDKIFRHVDPSKALDILTPKGRMQSILLSKRLKAYNLTKIYSSDLKRALDTLYSIKKHQKAKPVIKSEFREIHSRAKDGKIVFSSKKDLARAIKAWKIIEKIKVDGDVLIVCHGNFIKFILSRILDISLKQAYPFIIQNCSLTVLEKVDRKYKPFKILLVNGTKHLPKKFASQGDPFIE